MLTIYTWYTHSTLQTVHSTTSPHMYMLYFVCCMPKLVLFSIASSSSSITSFILVFTFVEMCTRYPIVCVDCTFFRSPLYVSMLIAYLCASRVNFISFRKSLKKEYEKEQQQHSQWQQHSQGTAQRSIAVKISLLVSLSLLCIWTYALVFWVTKD